MSVCYNDGSNVSKLEKKNTKDLPLSGKCKLWDIENIHRVLEENPQKSTCMAPGELGTVDLYLMN